MCPSWTLNLSTPDVEYVINFIFVDSSESKYWSSKPCCKSNNVTGSLHKLNKMICSN